MTDKPTDRYAILGAGQLGLSLMDLLTESGRPVTVVNRSGSLAEPIPTGVSIRAADLTDPDSVQAAMQDAHVAFLCAAPPYADWPRAFPPLARAVAEGVGRAGVKLVFADNLYMVGPTGGQPIREDLPYAATGNKGRARAEVASILLDAHEAGQVPVAIGRASDFFGPRVTDSVLGDRVFDAALAGKTVNVLGNPDLPHTYTYIRDFAEALINLADHEQAYGEVWHVPNPPTETTRQWLNRVGDQVGRPLNVRSAGPALVSVLALFSPQLREMKEMMYEFTEPYIVDDGKYRAAFPAQTTDPDDAVQATLDWYRRRAGA